MATVISSTAVRNNSCLRLVWSWTDGDGKLHGPNVSHVPLGTDVQAYADANEQRDLASLVEWEIAQNLEEIAG